MSLRLLIPLLALVSTFGVGCGAVEPGAGAPASAEVAPRDSLAFIVVDTDTTSEQWRSVQDLLARFPGLVEKLEGEGLDVDELSPALGDEVGIVVLPDGGADVHAVVLAQPTSRAKLDAFLDRAAEDEPRASREVEGWTALAETEAALDLFERARAAGSLAESATYTKAMEDLPAQALVTAFVDLEQAAELEELGRVFADAKAVSLGLALEARDDGLRLSGTLRADVDQLGRSTRPELLGNVPADAFLALWFDGASSGERLEQALLDHDAADDLESATGLTPAQLATLLDGEVVVFARPGLPTPEVGVLLESSGSELETVRTLLRRVARDAPVQVDEADGVVRATFKGGVSAPAAKLVDADRFKRALDAAGVPEETTGLMYLDFEGAAPLLAAFAGLGGANAGDELLQLLDPLRSLVVYGTGEPGEARFAAFLEIS